MVKTLVIFTYPSNVFWFSAIFPLLAVSMRYFSSLLSNGIASELIPSLPHLYQEKYNRNLSLFFSFCGFISIFLSTLSIQSFISKIPKDKQRGNFNLYTSIIMIFGMVMNFSVLFLNFLDINKRPFLTALNLSVLYTSASIFHICIGKIPARFTYIDDLAKIFNYVLVVSSTLVVLTFNVSCLTHKIDALYYISSIAQCIGILICFLKYILIGTIMNGDQFLAFSVEKKTDKKAYTRNDMILP
ncbi:hypothetical protein M9Y10_041846 [Tritrichomonas musculus]|uniref:Uncharacterized protein n=1 Tax=Tritrichomonas musculus TaxID=1915356 RepID=A0ABR2K6D6_9EUKA